MPGNLAGVSENSSPGDRARSRGYGAREPRVIQGQDLVLCGLSQEQRLHFFELVRHFRRRGRCIASSRRRCCKAPTCSSFTEGIAVAQHPRWNRWRRGCDPTVMVNRAVADHLEILRIVLRRCVGVCLVERVRHAHAFNWLLLDPVDLFGCLDAGGFKDRRHYVDDMVELRADATDIVDVTGP